MDENEDENENLRSQQNWMKQTNWKLIKYVIYHKHSMIPEQLQKVTLEEIIKIGHENPDTEEGKSNKEEERFTTASEMSEQDSESDTTADDTEDSKPTETIQVHNMCNTTMHDADDSTHDEDDSLEDENVTRIETYADNAEQNNEQENKLITTNFEVKVEK